MAVVVVSVIRSGRTVAAPPREPETEVGTVRCVPLLRPAGAESPSLAAVSSVWPSDGAC
jgi:hypothetical protein